MKKKLDKIQEIILQLQTKYLDEQEYLINNSRKLIEICKKIDESWTHSFAGFHSQLYFHNFSIPSYENRFNIEWGCIDGLPKGWQKKNKSEIKKEIENLVDDDFHIENLEDNVKKLRKEANSLISEIKIILSSINLKEDCSENILKQQIDNYTVDSDKSLIAKSLIPTTVSTRDSEAINEGIKAPYHIIMQISGRDVINTCNSIDNFISLANKLVKQLKLKKNDRCNNKWNFVNPFWLTWKLIILISKFFKRHKVGSIILSIVSTLLYIDYSRAWKNISFLFNFLK